MLIRSTQGRPGAGPANSMSRSQTLPEDLLLNCAFTLEATFCIPWLWLGFPAKRSPEPKTARRVRLSEPGFWAVWRENRSGWEVMAVSVAPRSETGAPRTKRPGAARGGGRQY